MRKNVLIVSPYHTGSHQQWADALAERLQPLCERVRVLSLPGQQWKERLRAGASVLAQQLLAQRETHCERHTCCADESLR